MRLLTALVLGAGVQQALAQEPTRVLTVGDRVRIEYRTPAGVARRTGALERISIDSVALRPTPRDALITIARGDIVATQVSLGPKSRVKGAFVLGAMGLFVGAMVREAATKTEWRDEEVCVIRGISFFPPYVDQSCSIAPVKHDRPPHGVIETSTLSGVALGFLLPAGERWQLAAAPAIVVSQGRVHSLPTFGLRITF